MSEEEKNTGSLGNLNCKAREKGKDRQVNEGVGRRIKMTDNQKLEITIVDRIQLLLKTVSYPLFVSPM